MKIAIIGATGNVGSRILAEAMHRGHNVTALARNPSRFQGQAHVTPVPVDVTNADALIRSLQGHDAIVSALHFDGTDVQSLIHAVRASGVKRLLVVGGAGSLEVAPGKVLVEQPGFPAEYKNEATAGKHFLDTLRCAFLLLDAVLQSIDFVFECTIRLLELGPVSEQGEDAILLGGRRFLAKVELEES